MKILGIDMGFSRVGFAIGDNETGIAFPKEIIEYKKYLSHIETYINTNINTESIKKIVIGIPNPLSYTTNESDHIIKIKDEIAKIKKYLFKKKLDIEIDTFDEQFTSKIAEQSLYTMGFSAKKQKGKKDAISAAILLQGYLDQKKYINSNHL